MLRNTTLIALRQSRNLYGEEMGTRAATESSKMNLHLPKFQPQQEVHSREKGWLLPPRTTIQDQVLLLLHPRCKNPSSTRIHAQPSVMSCPILGLLWLVEILAKTPLLSPTMTQRRTPSSLEWQAVEHRPPQHGGELPWLHTDPMGAHLGTSKGGGPAV